MYSLRAGSINNSLDIFIADSSVTTGAGKTGLAYNDVGLTAYYHRPGSASVLISLATLAAVTTAWTSGGFKEIDATHMPGWYRLDVPNAAFVFGVPFVGICVQGDTNGAPVNMIVLLMSAPGRPGPAAWFD